MKNKFFKYIAVASVFACAVMTACFTALNFPVETPKYPEAVSAIDYIGDIDKYVTTTRDARIGLHLKGNEASDLSVLATMTRYIGIEVKQSANELRLTNRFNEGENFLLRLNISDDTIVESVYNKQKQTLSFIVPAYRPMVSGRAWEVPTTTVGFLTNVLADSQLQLVGDKAFIFNTNDGSLSIPLGELRKSKIVILKQTSRNLLNSTVASFEDGAWSKAVSDCNKNGLGTADISMEISRDASNGYRSLLLTSNNHSACTNRSFDVNFKADRVYKFLFDYKSLEGESAQYYYRTGRGENAYQESQVIKGKTGIWQTFETPVEIKNRGVQPIDIYFYAASNGSKKVSNLYDNVRLLEYSQEARQITFLESLSSQSVNAIALPVGQNVISPEKVYSENLLDKEIASFESGLWTQQVADCNIRAAGTADISMAISSDATDGEYSLKLASKNHPACTNKRFSIELRPDQIYSLSFDYKNTEGQSGQFYYKLQGKGIESEYSKTLPPSINRWTSTTVDVVSDGISSGIDIYFYAPSSGDQVATLYDNVRLIKTIPKNLSQTYLIQEKVVPDGAIARLEFRPISAWKMLIKLHSIEKPVLLVIPNAFNHKIKAKIIDTVKEESVMKQGEVSKRNDDLLIDGISRKSEYTLPTSLHYRINNYSNGWFIDPQNICSSKGVNCTNNSDGTYEIDVVIESPPQRWFYLGLLISGTTLAGCLSYLGYEGVKSLRCRLSNRKKELV